MPYSSLDLTFAQKKGKTQLIHNRHYGSLIVQRALHPEASPVNRQNQTSGYQTDIHHTSTHTDNDICHIMILNPAAGIALGDAMEIKASLEPNTHAVLTTTGAGKWYGKGKSHIGESIDENFVSEHFVSDHLVSNNSNHNNEATSTEGRQNVYINLGDNSRAEWIPQENIIFDDARIRAITHFDLAPTASLLTWDILVLGRQAYQESFNHGNYANELVISRVDKDGNRKTTSKPIVFENVHQSADSRWFTSPLAVNGWHVIGTFWAIPSLDKNKHPYHSLDDTIDKLREHINTHHIPVVCTATHAGICIRYLGDDVRACFRAFSELRHVIRKLWWGVSPYEPRIWHT